MFVQSLRIVLNQCNLMLDSVGWAYKWGPSIRGFANSANWSIEICLTLSVPCATYGIHISWVMLSIYHRYICTGTPDGRSLYLPMFVHPSVRLSARPSVRPQHFQPDAMDGFFWYYIRIWSIRWRLMHVILDFSIFFKWPPGSHFLYMYLETIFCTLTRKLCM